METCIASFPPKNILLSGNEEDKWKSCRSFTPNFLGSMFDAMALHPAFVFDHSAQLPVNNHIGRCPGEHKTATGPQSSTTFQIPSRSVQRRSPFGGGFKRLGCDGK